MARTVLTEAQWAKMDPHCLGKPGDPGRSGTNNRLFIEGILWIVRTGSPWRDLPASFGKWTRCSCGSAIGPIPIDLEIYKWRDLIENFFCKLNACKRIAMRADKTDDSFKAAITSPPPSSIPGESQRPLMEVS